MKFIILFLFSGVTLLSVISFTETFCQPLPEAENKPDQTTSSLEPRKDNDSEMVIVLPDAIEPDDKEFSGKEDKQHASSKLEDKIKLLHKKEGLVKGMLVNENLGQKYFTLKRHNANKVISLKHLNEKIPKVKNSVSKSSIPKSRQKRFIFGSLRNIAVPLTIFHYLGFMPMRVPGLPYHIDPGLPDYTVYEPYNDLSYPEDPLYSRSHLNGRRRQYHSRY